MNTYEIANLIAEVLTSADATRIKHVRRTLDKGNEIIVLTLTDDKIFEIIVKEVM